MVTVKESNMEGVERNTEGVESAVFTRRVQGVGIHSFTLLFIAFACGFVVVSVETLGFRAFAPYFGTTTFVTGGIIGVVLLAMSVGYYLGGHLADRRPSVETLGRLLLLANIWLFALIYFYKPLLEMIAPFGPVQGVLLSTVVHYGGPMLLLSMTSPFLIRVMAQKDELGSIAGLVYAISTFGSLIGVFLTTFFMIPHLGVRNTLIVNCVLLLLAVLGCLVSTNRLYLGLALFPIVPLFMDARNSDAGLVLEIESNYSTIQVRADNPPVKSLKINEGDGQSFYDPNLLFQGGYRGKISVLPAVLSKKDRFLLLGLGGGTIASAWQKLFSATIDLVEIDPEVVKIAKEHFGLEVDRRTNVFVEDARRFVARPESRGRYDLVGVDLYNGNSVPSHTANVEFFQEIENSLSPDGMVAVNVAYPFGGAIEGIATTMSKVFENVLIVSSYPTNLVVLAGGKWMNDKDVISSRLRAFTMVASQRGEKYEVLADVSERIINSISIFRSSSEHIFSDDLSNFDELHAAAVAIMRDQMTLDIGTLESTVREAERAFPGEDINFTRAWLHVMTGDRIAAMEVMGSIVERNARARDAVYFLAEELIANSRLSEAETLVEGAVRNWPNDMHVTCLKGWISWRRSDRLAALQSLEKCRPYADTRVLYLELLTELYKNLGRSDDETAARKLMADAARREDTDKAFLFRRHVPARDASIIDAKSSTGG